MGKKKTEKKEKSKGLIHEFKEFISKGNVIDLAVGIIIGGAFTSIVNSLVNDIVMPIAGFGIGGLDFTQYKFVLASATETTEEVAITWGNFIQQTVNFLIIALVVFIMVKAVNKFKKKEEAKKEEKPVVSDEVKLLTEIRDCLKK